MTSAPRSASSIVAYGPASITPTSRIRMPDSGPGVIGVVGSSRKRSSHVGGQLRNDFARAVFRGHQFLTRLADRKQPCRQIGDACIGEAAEAREDRLLVACRRQVADVAGVTAIQQ